MTNKTILQNNLRVFNKYHKVKLDFGTFGAPTTYPYVKNEAVPTRIKLSESEAIDVIEFISRIYRLIGDRIPIKQHDLIFERDQ